jgi:hypothetical protein
MSRKLLIMAAVLAAVLIALVAGFTSFMAGQEQAWSAQHATLSGPAQTAVTAARAARQYFPLVALALAAGSFGVVGAFGILLHKK